MNLQSSISPRHQRLAIMATALLALSLCVFQVVRATSAHAAPNALQVNVISARTEGAVHAGDPITEFKYIINVDNTGTTEQRAPSDGCSPADPNYPDSCNWTSMGIDSSAPIYTQGDQSDFAGGGLDIPDGRYLISVLADGFKLDGAHFTVPLTGPVTVEMQPAPIPDATMQAAVFEDISPVNGAPDLPAEHGLAGFSGVVRDTLGEVTTDVYGSPLCGTGVCLSYCYVVDGGVDVGIVLPLQGPCPTDPTGLMMTTVDRPTAGSSFSTPVPATAAIEGKVKIPNLGTNRFTLSVTPPDGTNYAQTTTLEGNHDWDSWIMEGATGLDTEFVVAGEPFPAIIFGYAPGDRRTLPATGGATISGVIDIYRVYVPSAGGLPVGGDIFGGLSGGKLDGPIVEPWVALTDLDNGDTAVWVGRGDVNGAFSIPHVPDGNYLLTWWDDPQDYILATQNVTIANGEATDLGVLPLTGWWTEYTGYVFNDANRNGTMDWTDSNHDGCPQASEGETGVPNFGLTMRRRENTLMDRGTTAVSTDACGFYRFESAYPMTQWLVMEAYSDLYYTTGVTYQADNQPTPTTVVGAGVDVSVLPIIGLSGRMDWGVHAYSAAGNGVDPRNGGIVGTVSYDTTRNELDPRYAAVEDWQPGVPNMTVELWSPVECPLDGDGNPTAACDPTGQYALAPDGSYLRGTLLNATTTETWEQPGRNDDGICVPRDVEGNRLAYPNGQQITNDDSDCLEAPLMGVQFQNGYSTVDGNYGFGDGCFGTGGFDPGTGACADGSDPTALPGGSDYLVRVVSPEDVFGKPLYQFTREEDINIGNGDEFVPQVPPPACVGALHTVDVAAAATDGYGEVVGNGANGVPTGVTVPASSPVDNATFLDIGGSPYEGTVRPSCDTKLVPLANGKSIAPTFNVFTDVPLPGHFWGLLVDDLNFSTNPNQINFGEKAGVPFAPVGIYDWTNRLVYTVESDLSGLFDVLMPSTNRINCPTPSGVCGNVYRFVGNDPGTPGHLNPNYRPEFRTIAAEFESIPGNTIPADLAPTQVGVTVQLPGGQTTTVECAQPSTTPQLFAVSRPYVNGSGTFTIRGLGFGANKGTGSVTLDGTAIATSAWSDTSIDASVPAGFAVGPHQLLITNDAGAKTVNGLTFHVRGGSYNPNVYEVGPGHTYGTIQSALDAAAGNSATDLVVVFPGSPDLNNPRANPRGAYYENLILTTAVKLQGVGPGGFQGTTFVPGSIVDGGAFGGDSATFDAWYAKISTLSWVGNQNINDGAVMSIYAQSTNSFGSTFKASIDGFDIRGGDQQGFPNNVNQIGGGNNGLPANVVTQGGAIFANAYARSLQITNNVVENNGGGYGTIRIGTPDLTGDPNHNEDVRIANNRIIANGGTNLAGGIGLFDGSDRYEVASNDICGNFSAEYGGGITAYGLSPNGKIHDNRIWFNRSYDEGGGIMIAGTLPSNPSALSPGSGPVDIYNNLIQANLSDDDGGGIRFLMAGNFPMNVYNNMVVNNVATHEGGGVALDDAPNVRFYNNTVMKNVTTATAVTSNGLPAPAGLSTGRNSDPLQATLPAGSPVFSNPLLFNDIFWDNRAGTKGTTSVIGIETGDPNLNVWDIGVADGSGVLAPTNTVIDQDAGAHTYTTSPTNSSTDPNVVSPYNTVLTFNGWRTNPAFIGAILVSLDLPPELLGDYHLAADTTPAVGAASKAVPAYQQPAATLNAPAFDIDNQGRPSPSGFDAGADEYPGVVVTPPPPTVSDTLYYSTAGNVLPPGVTGTADDADIYYWDGSTHTRSIDVSALSPALPSNANVDGFTRVDATHFYMSFTDNVTITLPGPDLSVADEDVVYYSAGTWSMFFDGSARGLTGFLYDVDAISVVGGTLYFSTDLLPAPGAGGVTGPADVFRWNGGSSYTRMIGVTGTGGFGLPLTSNVDGLAWVDATHVYLSFSADTNVPGLGTVPDEDVVSYSAGTWSVYFDGTAHGLTNSSHDIDAFSLGSSSAPPPPPPPPVTFPATGRLDAFNRANSGNLGASWLGSNTGYRINSNTLEIRAGAASPKLYATSFGANQEAWFTFSDVSALASAQGLVLSSSTTGASSIRVTYRRATGAVVVETVTGGVATQVGSIPATFANGNTFGARLSGGSLTVYRNGARPETASTPTAWAGATGGGRIGLWFAGTTNTSSGNARIDNFGGGTLP